MIQMHLRVKDRLQDKNLIMGNLNSLGNAYGNVGQVKESIIFYEAGLHTAQQEKERDWESVFLGNLGLAYAALGDTYKAIELLEQALVIDREIGNRKGESISLICLGNTYSAIGDALKAIEIYEQALMIDREIGNQRGELIGIGNIGNRYLEFDEPQKAINLYKEALEIAFTIQDRKHQSIYLENTGHAFFSLGDFQKARESYQQAIQIADEISFTQTQNFARWGLAQAYLVQNDLVNARAIIEAALQYDVPGNNHDASALHGIVALQQGERETAQEAFTKSIAQADEILAKTPEYYDALNAKGLALCGLILCRGAVPAPDDVPAPTINDAIETFRKARKIAPHAGVVKSVLRLFDELVKCDEEGVLKDVRKAAEGS